jgi:hypothetical protein
MKRWLPCILVCSALGLSFLFFNAESQPGHATRTASLNSAESRAEQPTAHSSLPAPGKKVPIGNDYYFKYAFDKKPNIGTVIMKIELYRTDGKKDTSLEVKGDAGMPSMKGAHDMGERHFRLSSKGEYLLPFPIVMPGDWEIKLSFVKDGKVIFTGSHQFNV